MSFDFSNINPIRKAQATYKDGGGLGGGGMYMQQGRKQKNKNEDDDIFEYDDKNDSDENEIKLEVNEKDIPTDNFVNKFVNWFRIRKG